MFLKIKWNFLNLDYNFLLSSIHSSNMIVLIQINFLPLSM